MGHNPGAAGDVARQQNDKTKGHGQADEDFHQAVVAPIVKIRQGDQVHPVQGFGVKGSGNHQAQGQAEGELEPGPESGRIRHRRVAHGGVCIQ